MVTDLNSHCSRADIQMANRYTTKCSTSLVIRKMQIKPAMCYQHIPIRMTEIETTCHSGGYRELGGGENGELLFTGAEILSGTTKVSCKQTVVTGARHCEYTRCH